MVWTMGRWLWLEGGSEREAIVGSVQRDRFSRSTSLFPNKSCHVSQAVVGKGKWTSFLFSYDAT